MARSTRVAESESVCDYSIFTDICKETDRLERGEATLYGALSSLAPRTDLEKLFITIWMEIKKL